MAFAQPVLSVMLRLVINVVPWLIALQSVWDAATRVWLDKPVTFSLVVKIIFFALVGTLVTWKMPPHNLGPSLGHNVLALVKVILNVVLWITVIDRVWHIITTAWMSHPLEWSFVAYTVLLGVIASLVSWKWIPPELFGIR